MKHVICAGDIVGYGPEPNEVLNLMKEKGIRSVKGNYDEAVASYVSEAKDEEKTPFTITVDLLTKENKAYLGTLEDQIILEIENRKVLFVHGSPFSISEYVFETSQNEQNLIAEIVKEDIIVFGHTHLPYTKNHKQKVFVNTGSVGRPKDGDNRASYILATFDKECTFEIVRVSYDIDAVIKKIEQSEIPNEIAETIRTGRA